MFRTSRNTMTFVHEDSSHIHSRWYFRAMKRLKDINDGAVFRSPMIDGDLLSIVCSFINDLSVSPWVCIQKRSREWFYSRFNHHLSQIINQNTKRSFSSRLGSLLRTLLSFFTPNHQFTTIFFNRTLEYLVIWYCKDLFPKLFHKWTTSFECCFVINITEVSAPPKRDTEVEEEQRGAINGVQWWSIECSSKSANKDVIH